MTSSIYDATTDAGKRPDSKRTTEAKDRTRTRRQQRRDKRAGLALSTPIHPRSA